MKNAYKINKRTLRVAIWCWANGLWVRAVQCNFLCFNDHLFRSIFDCFPCFPPQRGTWHPGQKELQHTFEPVFYACEKLLEIVEGVRPAAETTLRPGMPCKLQLQVLAHTCIYNVTKKGALKLASRIVVKLLTGAWEPKWCGTLVGTRLIDPRIPWLKIHISVPQNSPAILDNSKTGLT